MKTGILLVASGTRDPAAACSLESIGRRVAERFKDVEVRWSYTSGVIRKKLAQRGTPVEAPGQALTRMTAEGFTHVAVGSLHLIAGMEYDLVREAVTLLSHKPNSPARFALSKPLLGSYEDLRRTAAAVLAELPAGRAGGDAVILVGHGNDAHPADLAYTAAAHVFSQLDRHVFLGTVKGHPALDDVLSRCRAAAVKKAWLLPFTVVAGRSTGETITGTGEGTWRSILTGTGIECVPVLKGLAEYDGVAAIWTDHIEEALRTVIAARPYGIRCTSCPRRRRPGAQRPAPSG